VALKMIGRKTLFSITQSLRTTKSAFRFSTGGSKIPVDLLSDAHKQSNKPSIVAFGDKAFQVNNILVRQSVILLPDHFLMWDARTFEDITIDNLSMLALVFPTIEVLFVGCGEVMPRPLPAEFVDYFRSKGIVVEATSTANAASTFNLLSADGRNVAAALLTPYPIEPGDHFAV
jgi:uncharacterized protein